MDDDTTGRSLPTSRHIAVWIDASPEAVYAVASDRAQLARWAAGLADPALGDADVAFVPNNEFGVLDHVVTLPTGESVYNPMRVVPAGGGKAACEVVFSLRRQPGVSDAQFEADAATVAADLRRLRDLVTG
jgi:hypothetical protein